MPLARSHDDRYWSLIERNKHIVAGAAHLTAFLALVPIPFLNLIAVAYFWRGIGARQAAVREHGKEAFAFQCMLCIPYFLLVPWLDLMLVRPGASIRLVIAAGFYILLLGSSAWGSIAAMARKDFKYPISVLRVSWPDVLLTIKNRLDQRASSAAKSATPTSDTHGNNTTGR